MKKNLRLVAAITLASSLVLSACGSSDDEGGDGDTIRIASIAPMTGPASVYGKSNAAAIQFAVDEVNEAGGVDVNGTKHQVELTLLDDEQNPETAQSVARKATDDGFDFIFGPFGSGTATATQSLMAQSDAYFQLLVATVPGPTKNPNVFRSGALIATYTDTALEYLEAHPEIETVGMITDQMHTGLLSETERFTKGIEDLGREVVVSQKMQLGDTDFRAPLTQMKAEAPDLYVLRGYPAETALITKQAQELGIEVPLFWTAGMTTAEANTLVDDEAAMENVVQGTPLANLDPYVAAGDEKATEIVEGTEGEAGTFAAGVYDGMQIFFAGLENAEEATPEALEESLSKLKVTDVKGHLFQEFLPQDGDLLFKDREISVKGGVVVWEPGTGFVLEQ